MAQHILHSTYKREKETEDRPMRSEEDGGWDLYAYVKAGVQGIMADEGRQAEQICRNCGSRQRKEYDSGTSEILWLEGAWMNITFLKETQLGW